MFCVADDQTRLLLVQQSNWIHFHITISRYFPILASIRLSFPNMIRFIQFDTIFIFLCLFCDSLRLCLQCPKRVHYCKNLSEQRTQRSFMNCFLLNTNLKWLLSQTSALLGSKLKGTLWSDFWWLKRPSEVYICYLSSPRTRFRH